MGLCCDPENPEFPGSTGGREHSGLRREVVGKPFVFCSQPFPVFEVFKETLS